MFIYLNHVQKSFCSEPVLTRDELTSMGSDIAQKTKPDDSMRRKGTSSASVMICTKIFTDIRVASGFKKTIGKDLCWKIHSVKSLTNIVCADWMQKYIEIISMASGSDEMLLEKGIVDDLCIFL